MNDFERAICRKPEDEELRLVYADWLEERGDSRGEFIRVQIEISRINAREGGDRGGCYIGGCASDLKNGKIHPSVCRKCKVYYPLLIRERELLKDKWREWTCNDQFKNIVFIKHDSRNTLAPNHIGVEFRRGFVEKIYCTPDNWYGAICLECNGLGGRESYSSDDPLNQLNHGSYWYPCHYCDSGKVKELGEDIVKIHPITYVCLVNDSDKEARSNAALQIARNKAFGDLLP